MIISNTLFQVVLRSPEILSLVLEIKESNDSSNDTLTLYFKSNINEIFGFLFLLHPVFQFFLFYKFNRTFRESFKDAFKKNTGKS